MSTKLRVREPFNAWSHWAGAGLAVLGIGVLFWVGQRTPLQFAAFGIYGFCLLLLYCASALYHSLHKGVNWLQKLDHVGIYLMIAGTYTPLCLLALDGPWRVGMLVAQWSLALVGIVATLVLGQRPKALRLVLYLVMGWMAVAALAPLHQSIGPSGIAWMFAGGLVYTLGTIVYAARWPKLWPGRFGSHELWHLFVLGGSLCHFALMVRLAQLPQ